MSGDEVYMYDFSGEGFDNIVVKDEDEILHIRTNAVTKEQAIIWKNVYCKKFSHSFNVVSTYHISRGIYHARYRCLFGDHRHKGKKKTNKGCPVVMNIKVKSASKDIVKKDKLVKTHPCFVTILGKHNHDTADATTLRQLRVLPDTAEEFFNYFERGMTPAEAIRYHQEKLHSNSASLENNSINPATRIVYHLHEAWKKGNCAEVVEKTTEVCESEAEENVPSVENFLSVEVAGSGTESGESLSITFEYFLVKFREAYDKFGDSESEKVLDMAVKRMKSIKSSSEFNRYISSLGSSRFRIRKKPSSGTKEKTGLPGDAAPAGEGQNCKIDPE